jgi:hypothetical protein
MKTLDWIVAVIVLAAVAFCWTAPGHGADTLYLKGEWQTVRIEKQDVRVPSWWEPGMGRNYIEISPGLWSVRIPSRYAGRLKEHEGDASKLFRQTVEYVDEAEREGPMLKRKTVLRGAKEKPAGKIVREDPPIIWME